MSQIPFLHTTNLFKDLAHAPNLKTPVLQFSAMEQNWGEVDWSLVKQNLLNNDILNRFVRSSGVQMLKIEGGNGKNLKFHSVCECIDERLMRACTFKEAPFPNLHWEFKRMVPLAAVWDAGNERKLLSKDEGDKTTRFRVPNQRPAIKAQHSHRRKEG